MQRRSFLSGIIAAAAAPAIVKAGSLMPIWVPKWHRGGFTGSGTVYLNGSAFGKTLALERNEVLDSQSLPGRTLYVSSATLPGSFGARTPFRTLREACDYANVGDTVLVLPGHTEWENPRKEHALLYKPGVSIDIRGCRVAFK